MEGQKELLGMWIAQTEGAKFWFSVFTELQNRGVKDLFIACVDGLTGLPEAIETLYPQTRVQVYLELFAEKWDRLYPTMSKMWRARWSRVIPLFAFPEDIRKVIHTTNAIESVNMSLRKVTRNHRIFPSDEAVFKVTYLAIQNIAKKWTMPIHNWKPALNCFAIEFAGRFPQ